MLGIKSVLINVTENKLKRRALPNVQSDLEEEKSRSQGKVAIKEFSSRSIPMLGIKSVLINVIENKLNRRG